MIKRAELQVLRARFALEKAQSRKKLLTDYTRDRKVKQLEAAVKKAQADEQARLAILENKLGEAKRLADSCSIVAPIDGRLRYDLQGPYPTHVGSEGGTGPTPVFHRAPGLIRSAREPCARHRGWTRPPMIHPNLKSTCGFASRRPRSSRRVDCPWIRLLQLLR